MKKSRDPLRLNRQTGKLLGVCAGVADFLGVAPWTVRLLLIAAVLLGAWFMVPVYFLAWLLIGNDSHGDILRKVNQNATVRHLRTVDYRKGLYRNSRDGRLLGVCAGIADYLEVDVFWVRVLTLVTIVFSGFVALLAYIAAYFILNDQPALREPVRDTSLHEGTEPELDETVAAARNDVARCSRRFASLQTRLNRLEAYVTSRRFRVQRDFRRMAPR